MLKLVGTRGCSRCIVKKNELTKRQIDFEYVLFENLDEEQQERVMKYAEELGIKSFPIMLDD